MAQQGRPTKRQQAPSLFVPPSRDVSTADFSQQSQEYLSRNVGRKSNVDGLRTDAASTTTGFDGLPVRSRANRAGKVDNNRTDLTWTEMQNTLEEVELNAASGANVFSSDHARALEDLRKAQIELAQAWTRGQEEDDAATDVDLLSGQVVGPKIGNESSGRRGAVLGDGHQRKESKATSGASEGNRPRTSSTRDEPSLEEETENDIKLARKRREANDRYFERVNKGVADVIAKLETVASKMRDVETASQDIWNSEQESLAS